MRAIDRMYFERHAVDPESENFIYEMSAETWNQDPGDREIEPDGLYDEDWPEVE